jgi:hypothetical protein
MCATAVPPRVGHDHTAVRMADEQRLAVDRAERGAHARDVVRQRRADDTDGRSTCNRAASCGVEPRHDRLPAPRTVERAVHQNDSSVIRHDLPFPDGLRRT